MGSVNKCYREFLNAYIKATCVGSGEKYNKYTEDDYLYSLKIEDLEELVLCFNQNHKEYACFEMGAMVASKLADWDTGGQFDTLNASIGAIDNVFELLKIKEPEEIDFNPIGEWKEEIREFKSASDTDLTFTLTSLVCNICGERSPLDKRYAYCPNCGKKMKNAKESKYV